MGESGYGGMTWIMDHGWVMGHGSWVVDHGSWIMDLWLTAHGSLKVARDWGLAVAAGSTPGEIGDGGIRDWPGLRLGCLSTIGTINLTREWGYANPQNPGHGSWIMVYHGSWME